MKKTYHHPFLRIVILDDSDVIATSLTINRMNGDEQTETEDTPTPLYITDQNSVW